MLRSGPWGAVVGVAEVPWFAGCDGLAAAGAGGSAGVYVGGEAASQLVVGCGVAALLAGASSAFVLGGVVGAASAAGEGGAAGLGADSQCHRVNRTG